MKQLKFMLAAATAISLATASQAADYQSSTDFEADAYTIGDFNPGAGSGWVSPTENYSAIVERGAAGATSYTKKYGNDASTHKKALYVETATEPLLRHIEIDNAGAVAKTLSSTAKVYIDTMVQFTVTPDGEEPTPGDDDKLMLYAKKDGGTTKLYVVAAEISTDEDYQLVHTVKTVNTGKEVVADTWYRLTVEAYACTIEGGSSELNLNLFKVYLNGEIVPTGDTALIYTDNEKVVFPSIQGMMSLGENGESLPATITSVGFAGEGMVDDLVLTPDDPFETTPTTVDFTFAWTTACISAVKYAIGDATEYTDLGENEKLTDLDPDDIIKIQITPADWYAVKEGADLEYTASEEAADLDDLVTKLASKVDPETGVVVINPDNSVTVAQIQEAAGITGGAFYDANTSKADLEKVLTWKKNKGGANYNINNIAFGVPADQETDDTKAYLLNCSKDELADEVANFKFPAIVPGVKPSVNAPLHGGKYNGTLKIYGADTVGGLADKVEATADHKFFKAVLTK